jgi:hypothetical protein
MGAETNEDGTWQFILRDNSEVTGQALSPLSDSR